jgi:hypothetical protein
MYLQVGLAVVMRTKTRTFLQGIETVHPVNQMVILMTYHKSVTSTPVLPNMYLKRTALSDLKKSETEPSN